jgi:hypothetical protein
MTVAPSLTPVWREAPDRGSGDPPKQPRRRRAGWPPRKPSPWEGGEPPAPQEGFLDRVIPWAALAAMTLALAFPHLDSFPSLEGRESWPLVAGLESAELRRLPGALAVLAACLLFFGALQHVASRLVAFLAAMMLAVSPAAMQAALQANGDGVSLLAVAVIPMALIRGLDPEQDGLWPSLAVWGALLATAPFGDPAALLSLLGGLALLWRPADRAGLSRMFRPALTLAGVAAVLAAFQLLPGGADQLWRKLSAIGSGSVSGALALPLLLLPALPLLAARFALPPAGRSGRIWRVALATGSVPMAALLLAPWRDWSIAMAVLPSACLIAALALDDDRALVQRARHGAGRTASRAAILLWAAVAGGLALALLAAAEGRAATIAIEGIFVFCAIALGLMWGWQGRSERLALTAVLASSLICAGAMEVISTGGLFLGYPFP